VAGWDRSDRCTCDAAYTVARGSHADYSKTIQAWYSADKLTADESSGDQRGGKPLTRAGIHPYVLDEKAIGCGLLTRVQGPAGQKLQIA
jgi:hypothetical protein